MKTPSPPISAWLFFLLWASTAAGEQPEPAVAAAEKLLSATVTVRVSQDASLDGATKAVDDRGNRPQAKSREIAVCSGVSLGDGLIVTFVSAPATARFRITLPDGDQAQGRLSVVDLYSGLTLLEIDQRGIARLELVETLPSVGSQVITAAAWGIEQPAVASGVLGGIDHAPPGVGLPPLLLGAVHSTETSIGAALVDRHGRLLGIIAATGSSVPYGGCYAVSVHHVRRLVGARRSGRLTVLERRFPVMGLRMRGGDNSPTVNVEWVDPQGPAARAGIALGDRIVAIDHKQIRSVYQAVAAIRRKQPGDTLSVTVKRDSQANDVAVTLGGGEKRAGVSGDARRLWVGPQVTLLQTGPREITLSNRGASVADANFAADQTRGFRSARSRAPENGSTRLDLLEKQASRYEQRIMQLRKELSDRYQAQVELEGRLRSLVDEVERLRQRVESPRPTGVRGSRAPVGKGNDRP